jgi:hypothetical protein
VTPCHPTGSPFCWDLPALDGVRGGSGVSEVVAAFVASLNGASWPWSCA